MAIGTSGSDPGSIEAGDHAGLAVPDREYFAVPDEDIKRIASLLTIGSTMTRDVIGVEA